MSYSIVAVLFSGTKPIIFQEWRLITNLFEVVDGLKIVSKPTELNRRIEYRSGGIPLMFYFSKFGKIYVYSMMKHY